MGYRATTTGVPSVTPMSRSSPFIWPADECALCGVELQADDKEICKMCNPHVPPVPPPRSKYCERWLAEVTLKSNDAGSFTMSTGCGYPLKDDGSCTNTAPHQGEQ